MPHRKASSFLFYGAGIMEEMGMNLRTVRAGHANMFLSPVFAESFAHLSGCPIELYNTDGALGAAEPQDTDPDIILNSVIVSGVWNSSDASSLNPEKAGQFRSITRPGRRDWNILLVELHECIYLPVQICEVASVKNSFFSDRVHQKQYPFSV